MEANKKVVYHVGECTELPPNSTMIVYRSTYRDLRLFFQETITALESEIEKVNRQSLIFWLKNGTEIRFVSQEERIYGLHIDAFDPGDAATRMYDLLYSRLRDRDHRFLK